MTTAVDARLQTQSLYHSHNTNNTLTHQLDGVAEFRNAHRAVVFQEDAVRLHVAVNDVLARQIRKALKQLLSERFEGFPVQNRRPRSANTQYS